MEAYSSVTNQYLHSSKTVGTRNAPAALCKALPRGLKHVVFTNGQVSHHSMDSESAPALETITFYVVARFRMSYN